MAEEIDGIAPDYQVVRIGDALVADPRVQELGLQVRVAGGVVVVAGTVSTPQRQAAVADVVHDLLPGAEVRNDVVVVELSGADHGDDRP